MSRPDKLQLGLGIAAVAITRILFRSHVLYDLDSVNFALGMRRFDPSAHQPHPPGYFLYVLLGSLLNPLFGDANGTLVAISIAASCGAAWMIYLLAREWYGTRTANLSLLLFVVSPLAWFHGIVALTYMVESFFSALFGYLCWRRYVVWASVVYAVAAGFRPSTALLLGPLWLFALWHTDWRRRWLGLSAAAATMLAWFLPMAAAAGGLSRYVVALRHLWSSIPGQQTTLQSGWLAIARFFTIGWIFVVCFGAAAVVALWGRSKSDPERRRFAAVWVLPGLLFFTFVFLNYINSGYLLVLAPPAFAWIAGRMASRRIAWPWITAGIAVNCAFFLFAPVYCSYRSVREFERDLSTRVVEMRQNFDPSDTLVVGFDSHFLGYRHAGYYLPEFTVAQYPEVRYPEGKRTFVMQNGDTTVTGRIPARGFRRFVLFPLPEGANYAEYVHKVLEKLPKDSVVQPASAVPLLFPETGR